MLSTLETIVLVLRALILAALVLAFVVIVPWWLSVLGAVGLVAVWPAQMRWDRAQAAQRARNQPR